MADAARDTLLASVKSLLASSDYSDLTITCGADTYNVHKSIVCSRSEFLRNAERFPVGEEAVNKTIDLSEDEPEVVKLLIQYLYEGEYDPKLPHGEEKRIPDGPPIVTVAKRPNFHYKFPHTCQPACPSDYLVCPHHECRRTTCGEACQNFVCGHCCGVGFMDGGADQLLLHAKMYEIGDKYNVVGLKPLAQEKFARSCNLHWNTEHFAPAANYAFSTTPENDHGLRDIVSKTISDHIGLLNKPAVEAVLNEFNGLAVSVLKMKAKATG